MMIHITCKINKKNGSLFSFRYNMGHSSVKKAGHPHQEKFLMHMNPHKKEEEEARPEGLQVQPTQARFSMLSHQYTNGRYTHGCSG